MYYDEAMQKFREIYKKDKNTKCCLVHNDNKSIIEFTPQLDDRLIQYNIVSGAYNIKSNSITGYIDHINIDLLLSDKWSLIKN